MRSNVKVSYRQAGTTPSRRERLEDVHPAFISEAKKPKGLSPLALYIEDNRDSGIPIAELVEQFQEFDCEHTSDEEVSRTATEILFICADCGRVRHARKAGM